MHQDKSKFYADAIEPLNVILLKKSSFILFEIKEKNETIQSYRSSHFRLVVNETKQSVTLVQ